MVAQSCAPGWVLRRVHNTRPFADYCALRRIRFRAAVTPVWTDELRRWAAALARLPAAAQAQVERELAMIDEMADPEANAHLLEADDRIELPPDHVPAGAPLALWFLVHAPETFHEVFHHHEARDVDAWHHARASPGLAIRNLRGKGRELAEELRAFFRLQEGCGRFCEVDAFLMDGACCFLARVSGRVRLIESFSDRGEATLEWRRPAFTVVFVYDPRNGTIRLRSRLRAHDRLLDLFRRFGRSVLGVDLGEHCLGRAFDLDRLKRGFHPLPDAGDMELVRVKSLHLRYPQRCGGRQVKLETHAGDEPDAMQKLLHAHVSGCGLLAELRVCHAELQVRLRVGSRSRNCLIHLWPDRADLDGTPLGQRFLTCLEGWGLSDAIQP